MKVFVAENEKTQKLIRQENEETRKLLNELILTIKDTSEQSIASQLGTSTKIACKMEQCLNYTLKLLKETLSCTNRNKMKEGISKAKESIQAEWNKKYKLHNELFWKFHRNQRLEEIYTFDLEKEKPNSYQILTEQNLLKKNCKLLDIKDNNNQSNISILI